MRRGGEEDEEGWEKPLDLEKGWEGGKVGFSLRRAQQGWQGIFKLKLVLESSVSPREGKGLP